MTDEEFKTWDRHQAENLQVQRDDAIARLADCEKKLAELAKSHEERSLSYVKEVAALKDSHAADLQALRDAHKAEILREAKIRDLDAKIAEIEKLKIEIG